MVEAPALTGPTAAEDLRPDTPSGHRHRSRLSFRHSQTETGVIPRSELAAARAIEARAALASCRLCAHRCAVNRLEGETGLCHAGPVARCFSAQTEVTDELELIPVFAVAFSGCDLRCDFCITGRESWDARAGEPLTLRRPASPSPFAERSGEKGDGGVGVQGEVSPEEFALRAREPDVSKRRQGTPLIRPPAIFSHSSALARQWEKAAVEGKGQADNSLSALAARACRALEAGARSVMILGGEPTIHLPTALEFAALLPEDATLVWKTNAHATDEARRLLDGVFDVWVADYKFGNDACAQRLARVPDYTSVVRENLRWASPRTELIVRHLVMPGHVECCWRPVAAWLAGELPYVLVNLRTGFWPGWFSARHPELRRTVRQPESEAAFEIARIHGLNLVE